MLNGSEHAALPSPAATSAHPACKFLTCAQTLFMHAGTAALPAGGAGALDMPLPHSTAGGSADLMPLAARLAQDQDRLKQAVARQLMQLQAQHAQQVGRGRAWQGSGWQMLLHVSCNCQHDLRFSSAVAPALQPSPRTSSSPPFTPPTCPMPSTLTPSKAATRSAWTRVCHMRRRPGASAGVCLQACLPALVLVL